MNLRWLEAFQAVINFGSVTQAAQHLNVTQPAVSRMINNLEAELGFRLFVRAHGRIMPTTACDRFCREVDPLLAALGDISLIAKDIRENRGGCLRVVSMSAIAHGLLPTVLKDFLGLHPDLRLSVDIRERRDVQRWLAGQQFDIGIAAMPLEHTGLRCVTFINTELFAVLPLGHALAHKTTLVPRDLLGERLVMLPGTALLRHEINRILQKEDDFSLAMIETSSLHLACELVSEGLGITVADVFTVAELEHQHRLAFRPLSASISRTYAFLFPTSRPPSELAVSFADAITVAATSLVARVHSKILGSA
jgi:DNA-binding transcriptional LysR family regulator